MPWMLHQSRSDFTVLLSYLAGKLLGGVVAILHTEPQDQKETVFPSRNVAERSNPSENAWYCQRQAGLGKCVEIQPLSAVCEDSDLESAEVSLGKVCSLQGLGMFTRFETSTKYSLLHAILIYCCDPAATGRSDFSARELTTSQKIAVTSAPNCIKLVYKPISYRYL